MTKTVNKYRVTSTQVIHEELASEVYAYSADEARLQVEHNMAILRVNDQVKMRKRSIASHEVKGVYLVQEAVEQPPWEGGR